MAAEYVLAVAREPAVSVEDSVQAAAAEEAIASLGVAAAASTQAAAADSVPAA